MSNNATRHFISFFIACLALFAFIGGYFCAANGWWWVGFATLIVYGGVYNAIK